MLRLSVKPIAGGAKFIEHWHGGVTAAQTRPRGDWKFAVLFSFVATAATTLEPSKAPEVSRLHVHVDS